MENNIKSYKGEARILRKDGRYTSRKWRAEITNLGKWIREREKFLREIYHFKTFDLNMTASGVVTLNCQRPEGKYNGCTLRRMHAIYIFTPIQ